MDILVIDDDMALQRMVRHVLEKEGSTVRVADSAEAGLVELRRKAPDLLVLDVRLPGMSGFDLCCKIRQEKEFGTLPVIFLTSKADVVNRVWFLDGRRFIDGDTPSIADIRLAASLEFLRAIDYAFPAWAEEYMAAVEEALGDAYTEPAADVRGYIDYVKGQAA